MEKRKKNEGGRKNIEIRNQMKRRGAACWLISARCEDEMVGSVAPAVASLQSVHPSIVVGAWDC